MTDSFREARNRGREHYLLSCLKINYFGPLILLVHLMSWNIRNEEEKRRKKSEYDATKRTGNLENRQKQTNRKGIVRKENEKPSKKYI